MTEAQTKRQKDRGTDRETERQAQTEARETCLSPGKRPDRRPMGKAAITSGVHSKSVEELKTQSQGDHTTNRLEER